MYVSPLRIVSWLFAIVVIGAPIAAVAFFLLAVLGNPGSCETEGRPITSTLEAVDSFLTKWDQLNATLAAGQLSTIVIDESEATSRARVWVEQHDVPASDLTICFKAAGGSASAQVDIPFIPGDVDVLIEGTVILTGDQPEAVIDEIMIGGLPGLLSDVAKRFVDDLIQEQTEQIELVHDYGLAFGEGEMTISGQP